MVTTCMSSFQPSDRFLVIARIRGYEQGESIARLGHSRAKQNQNKGFTAKVKTEISKKKQESKKDVDKINGPLNQPAVQPTHTIVQVLETPCRQGLRILSTWIKLMRKNFDVLQLS